MYREPQARADCSCWFIISSGLINPRERPKVAARHIESILNGTLRPLTKFSVGWRIKVTAVEKMHSLFARFVRVEEGWFILWPLNGFAEEFVKPPAEASFAPFSVPVWFDERAVGSSYVAVRLLRLTLFATAALVCERTFTAPEIDRTFSSGFFAQKLDRTGSLVSPWVTIVRKGESSAYLHTDW